MKVAIVTGSRRGIGLGIAKSLGQEGYTVVISGTAERAETLTAALVTRGIDAHYQKCDITRRKDREALLAFAAGRFGRIDLLVNNAGIAPAARADLLDMAEESFDRVLDTNLKGTFFLTQSAAREMLRMQGCRLPDYHPRIINISSISAYTASVNRGEYCISKAGVSMVTELFADRLAEAGIPVFEIRPGIIDTDMIGGVREKYENMVAGGVTPIRRLGRPEDIGDCVAALCSGRLDFCTGQVINADGGFHIRRL